MIQIDNELYHHGVKGMKWGIRKDQRLARNKMRFHAESKSADKYYRSSMKHIEKAATSKTRLDEGAHLGLGARQMALAQRHSKEATRRYKKVKHLGGDVTINEQHRLNKEKAGEMFVKKSAVRYMTELNARQTAAGIAFLSDLRFEGRIRIRNLPKPDRYKVNRRKYKQYKSELTTAEDDT